MASQAYIALGVTDYEWRNIQHIKIALTACRRRAARRIDGGAMQAGGWAAVKRKVPAHIIKLYNKEIIGII